MKNLKYLVIFIIPFIFPITSQADDVSAVSEKMKDIDNIENRVFGDIDMMVFFPSENEWKAKRGIEYLYCSALADILGYQKESREYYSKGMDFLDFHAQDFVKDKSLNKTSMIVERIDHSKVLAY